MKKIRIGSVVLLFISAAIFTMFGLYERENRDHVPPVISYPKKELVVRVSDDEKAFLKDVCADDEKSGDVSNSLVVEKMSDFTGEGTRVVMYAAMDEKGNVGRKERTIRYEDYQAPIFTLNGPLRYPAGKPINVFERIGAESVLDGDLSSKVKYSLEQTVNVMNAGKYPIEFRVMDSGANNVYLQTELEIYDPQEERIQVRLNKYLVYLDVNAVFQPQEYYAGADEEGTLEVQSHVDVTKPGVYYVDYIVRGKDGSGKSRLVVVVNEG